MSSSDPVADVLAALAARFDREGLRWYLFGARAATLWGRPRTSLDVDVTVELPPDRVRDLVSALEADGFRLRVQSGVEEFVARTRVLPLLHLASDTPVDVVLAGPGIEERFLERAVDVPLGDRMIPVIAPEHLIVTKVLAGRPKDIEDVRGILAERAASLDVEEIRSLLESLQEALGQSDLLPLFETELTRAAPRRLDSSRGDSDP